MVKQEPRWWPPGPRIVNKDKGAVSPKKDRVFHNEFFLHPLWIASNFVPLMSYRAPIFQQTGPWDSPRQNHGENTDTLGPCSIRTWPMVAYKVITKLQDFTNLDKHYIALSKVHHHYHHYIYYYNSNLYCTS